MPNYSAINFLNVFSRRSRVFSSKLQSTVLCDGLSKPLDLSLRVYSQLSQRKHRVIWSVTENGGQRATERKFLKLFVVVFNPSSKCNAVCSF